MNPFGVVDPDIHIMYVYSPHLLVIKDCTVVCKRFKTISFCQQVNYGVVTSTEVAYFSYIYSVIPIENYQRATGYLRSAMLAGYTFGASLGQMLVSFAGTSFKPKQKM